MTEQRKPLPRHVVTILYSRESNNYVVRCNVCGRLDAYHSWTQANNRRATHLRGQDAGRD